MNKAVKSVGYVCFRQWSRKKFSVLSSLSKVIKIGVLCLAYSLVNRIPVMHAQTDTTSILTPYELEEIEITGQRSQVVTSDISRVVTVIQRDEIEKAGVQSILDLLEYVSNIDIRQRGNLGVQADISIRGSSFDHVMVLMNGIALSDPQTGHLSLDLPIDPESIKRVEILEGPAARTLGPGAFMGAINIITLNGALQEVSASYTMGEYNFHRTRLHAGFKTGNINHFFSVSRSSSSGYIRNTDHKLVNTYYRLNLQKDITSIDMQGGYQQKEFGARGFYAPGYPDQYEETSTGFGSLKISTGKLLRLNNSVYWRRKKDHFVLVRDNPSFYQNFHMTDIYGSQLNLTHNGNFLISTIGVDLRSENIQSNNIGLMNPNPKKVKGTDSIFYTKQYQRTNFAVFMEFLFSFKNLNISTGTMISWNTGFHAAPAFFPGLDMSLELKDNITLFTSINRSLHLPTFTDLFYTDPVNQGNADLNPNKMSSFEGGIRHTGILWRNKAAAFYNSGHDIVDWLWNFTTNRYSPVNLTNYEAYGLSASSTLDLTGRPKIKKWFSTISFHYIWLGIQKSIPDSVSKYNNLQHKLSLTFSQQPLKNLIFSWAVSYQDRRGNAIGFDQDTRNYYLIPYKPFWVLDGSIKWSINFAQFFFEASNILNTQYIDSGSAFQPGRWFKAGVAVKINKQDH